MTNSGTEHARVITVTSGKGGVGKTNIAVSLAIALANLGRRVTLIDMDLGLANVDLLLNLHVGANLSDVIAGRKRVDEILVDTPYKVRVVPGASGDDHLANLSPAEQHQLAEALTHLTGDTDYLIIDTGAGISRNTTMFTTSADEVLVVSTPEPTAMLDAYAVIKTVKKLAPRVSLHLLVNMARSEADARNAMRRISHIALNFIDSRLEEDGFILQQPEVAQAVRRRRPFIAEYPSCEASHSIRRIARALVEHPPAHAETPEHPEGFVARLMHALVGA